MADESCCRCPRPAELRDGDLLWCVKHFYTDTTFGQNMRRAKR